MKPLSDLPPTRPAPGKVESCLIFYFGMRSSAPSPEQNVTGSRKRPIEQLALQTSI